jgi:hypothetical protein
MWEFVTQKGIAMENKFTAWVWAMQAATYRVKIVTQNRNASASYAYEQAMEMQTSIMRIVQKSWIGSITVTAPCGCAYRFEKTENQADAVCDSHWVRAVFNGDIDE